MKHSFNYSILWQSINSSHCTKPYFSWKHKAYRNRLPCCVGEDSNRTPPFTSYKIYISTSRCFHKSPKWTEFQNNYKQARNGEYTPSNL